MPNQLAQESSPYLQKHADNPVDWYSWGEEALHRARQENKPIFLSIGYAACHWCHVMERKSFEDAETAALMNRHFVNIKVDREERPDLDSLDPGVTETAAERLFEDFDPIHGGWDSAPKFPQPMVLEFLLCRYARTREEKLLIMIDTTLTAMARGRIYDQIGGGFH